MISPRSAILSLSLFSIPLAAPAVSVEFVGTSRSVVEYSPAAGTGLNMVYVVYDTSQISEIVVSGVTSVAKAYRYSSLGGGYAEAIPASVSGSELTIPKSSIEGNMGYIVEYGSNSYYFWLVNYLPYKFSISSIEAADTQDCNYTYLNVEGSGDPIYYYSINGKKCTLSRDIEIDYQTLEWSEDAENFVQVSQTKTLEYLTQTVSIAPPIYCSTVFEISGDCFLSKWGIPVTAESSTVSPNGIAVETSATQTNAYDYDDEDADPSNVITMEVNGIGGSGPVDVSFQAWITDAVLHTEWQIANDSSFEDIEYRYNVQNLDFSFNEEGTFYVRFIGSNSDGSCEVVGETYTVSVGSSELLIPNAFTPNGDGINDVWKVAYRSLTKFSCYIYDRYGTQLYHFTDPSDGWDGKYKGKYVKPGVYFYVITATGTDGKTYKKGGDINIIGSKTGSTSTTTE